MISFPTLPFFNLITFFPLPSTFTFPFYSILLHFPFPFPFFSNLPSLSILFPFFPLPFHFPSCPLDFLPLQIDSTPPHGAAGGRGGERQLCTPLFSDLFHVNTLAAGIGTRYNVYPAALRTAQHRRVGDEGGHVHLLQRMPSIFNH